MTREEAFRKNFPEYCCGKEFLSPYFDLFCAGLEIENSQMYEKTVKPMQKQIDKAKELIKKLKALYFSPVVTNDDVKRQDEVLNEVEQFLKELE